MFGKRIFVVILALNYLLPKIVHCQNEASQWYFGSYAGLNFLTNPPTILLNGALTPPSPFPTWGGEGMASMSNSSGAILFYTDGQTIWNQNHIPMANGTGLLGSFSSVQAAIILKQPGNNTNYYVFTPAGAGNGPVYYSIVDMSLAAGTGSVTVKNIALMQNTTEAITATRHCNGVDYWIVCKDLYTSFYSYSLSASGLVSPAVISPSGTNSYTNNFIAMKISPNGNKLAVSGNQGLDGMRLYDFDNSTGIISNHLLLYQLGFYGCEFSPDGSKLYGSGTRLIQWDLCAGTGSAAIIASQYTVSMNSNFFSAQQAPNGKIYFIRTAQSSVDVINNPNSGGSACNYVQNGQSIAPRSTGAGLPNFEGSIFKLKGNWPFNYTVGGVLGCQEAIFTPSTFTNCSAYGSPPNGYLWYFGDVNSGTANSSTLTNPSHVFSALGSYTVSLIRYYPCGAPDTVRQTVLINQPCVSIQSSSITCANLGSATVTPIPGAGPFTYTWLPGQQTTSAVSGLAPGTYTVYYGSPSSNISSSLTVTFIPLVPLTGSITASSSIVCNGVSTGTGSIFALQGGSGSQTYLWTNGTQSLNTANVNSLSAGIWNTSATDALTGCQINQSFIITQPPPLVLNITASTPTTCVGTSVSITGTNSGGTPGYTYTWTNAPPSNTVVVSENAAGTYVYTLSSLDANQCLSSNTIALNFIANPILSVTDVSICPLKFGTLTASGATSYTWTLSSTTLGLTGPTMTDNPLADTQYTVVGSALGCTAVATASIILYPVPVPIIQSNSPRCEGTSLDVNASGGIVYQWSGPSSFNSNLPFNTIPGLGLNHGGTYNLTVTSVNGCTASTSANLVVNPIPTVSAAGSTICTSQTLSLYANSAGSSFVWNGPMNFISSVQNPTLANPVLARTGTYTVKATSVPGCTNSAVATVSVTTPPSLSVALSSGSLCSQAFNGSPNTITLTASGGNSYTLFTPNLIGASTPVSPSASLIAVPPYSSSVTVGTATLQGSNGVCDNQSTFVFTVVPNPTVGVNSYTPVICAGQNFTYTSNGANSYVWTATTSNYTTYSNGGVAVAHPSINAVFSVYGSSLGCNSALQTSSITVNPIPTLTLSAASNSICLNENTKLSVAGTGTSFTWSPATGLSNTTNSAVVASPLTSQSYTVLVSVANCTNAANLNLTVLPLPTPKIDFVTPAVCLNGQISFKGSGGVLYEWRGTDHLYMQGQNLVFEALSSSYAGNYTLTVTDLNGCKSSTVTTVEILPAPSGYLSNFKEEACAPYCTTFNFLSSDKNKSVKSSWMINDQFLNGNTFSYCFSSAGVYTINGTFFDEITSCKNTTSYLLNVHPKPKADFIFSPKQPIEGQDEVIFTNNSSGDGNLSFNWYFNDNKGYSTNQKNTSYIYNEPGEYRVVLVSKNNWKCADTIIKVVKVESDFALYVPNAFTPNGDERNDVFLPVVRSVKKYDLKIFDRWGKMIFQTTDANQGWDGTFNGILCKQDVYIWKIHVVSLDGKEKSETGNVTSLPSE